MQPHWRSLLALPEMLTRLSCDAGPAAAPWMALPSWADSGRGTSHNLGHHWAPDHAAHDVLQGARVAPSRDHLQLQHPQQQPCTTQGGHAAAQSAGRAAASTSEQQQSSGDSGRALQGAPGRAGAGAELRWEQHEQQLVESGVEGTMYREAQVVDSGTGWQPWHQQLHDKGGQQMSPASSCLPRLGPQQWAVQPGGDSDAAALQQEVTELRQQVGVWQQLPLHPSREPEWYAAAHSPRAQRSALPTA